MLRTTKFRPAPLSRGSMILVLSLFAVAGPRATQAAPPAQNDEAAARVFDLTYVPDDPYVLAAIRPQALLSQPGMAPLRKILLKEELRDCGATIPELVEMLWIGGVIPTQPDQAGLFVLRRDKPFGVLPVLKRENVKPVRFQGKTYYKTYHKKEHLKGVRPQWVYYQPDLSTLLIGGEAQIRRVIAHPDARPKDAAWLAMWNRVAKDHAAVMIDLARLERQLAALPPSVPAPPIVAPLAPLWERGNRAVAGLNMLDDGLTIEGYVAADDAQGTEQVRKTLEAAVTLAQNALAAKRRELEQPPESERKQVAPRNSEAFELRKKLALRIFEAYELVLNGARVTADGATGAVHNEVEGKALASWRGRFISAVRAARDANQRILGQGNLSQIAGAISRYYFDHKHFPPAVVMGGKDGKTPHSWRVELLPYLGRKKLYDAYHLDEPWNSPANLKILKQMPVEYRAPTADAGATNSAYYLLVGPGAIFDGGEPTTLTEITDGLSNTILVVETKRDIPWTKPEDIAYDPKKPLPQLGGLFEGGFQAALAGVPVRFISHAIDKKVLRDLIEKADGHPVRLP